MCRAGASWVRDNILDAHPDAELAVYVVWLPMLGPDARSEVDLALLDDPRVTQFWDGERVAGRWLADAGVAGSATGGIVWDAFFVFGPEAAWNERPSPVATFGAPVISETSALEAELERFLD